LDFFCWRRFLFWSARGHLVVLWAAVQLALLLQDRAYLGIRQFGPHNALQIVGRTVSLLAAGAAALLRPGQAQSFIAFLIGADTVMLLIGGLLLQRYTVVRLPSRHLLWALTRLGARAFPVLLLPFLLIRSDILLMRLLRGAAETGVYSIAAQLIDFVLLLPAIFRRCSSCRFPIRKLAFRTHSRWGAGFCGCLSCPPSGCAFGWWRFRSCSGRSLAPPTPDAHPPAGSAGSRVRDCHAQYFARQGYPAFLAGALLLALLANIGVNLATIPQFGAMGAAFGSTVAYTLASLLIVRRFLMETGVSFRELWHAPRPDLRVAGAGGE
jgi:hypothetical protein